MWQNSLHPMTRLGFSNILTEPHRVVKGRKITLLFIFTTWYKKWFYTAIAITNPRQLKEFLTGKIKCSWKKNGRKMAILELLDTLNCFNDHRFTFYYNQYCNFPDKRNITYSFCIGFKGYYIFNPIYWFIYVYILIINQWTFTLHVHSWVLIQHKSLEA